MTFVILSCFFLGFEAIEIDYRFLTGTGGEEASLFAMDVFKMYVSFPDCGCL